MNYLTYQDNFPTINIEALACGTPVITYDTGGSKEMLNAHVGTIISKGDLNALIKFLLHFGTKKSDESINACIKQSESFTTEHMTNNYIDLYKNLLKTSNH